ncbi:MAG: DUF2076 domain-containing protein [Proteobacteria bacterium]|nr:DUF2076 domain-containing protein [Pseudomonadota bacterium]
MQSQERDLIEGLFNRLKAYESQPRDPEAERLIVTMVASQPGAPYLLAQTALVQEHALKAAQERIAELEAKAKQPGFLESAPKIGPWGAATAPTAPAAPTRSPSPWGAPQQPSAGGGFLRSALATAAGVAGGALLFDGIRNLLGSSGSPFGALDTSAAASPLMPPDQVSSADLAQDDSVAGNYDASGDSAGDEGSFSDDSTFDDSYDV